MRKYIDADRLEKDGWTMQRIRQVSLTEMVWETKKPTDFPATEVAEIRHGRWILNDNGTYSCSLCQSWIPNEQHHYARYCLYCGARMDGVEK